MVTTCGGGWGRGTGEGGQKGQTFSSKIKKYWDSNVQDEDCSQHCCPIYRTVVKRVKIPRVLITRREIFFPVFFYLSFLFMRKTSIWEDTVGDTMQIISRSI